jgi:hypothetical protein
VVSVIASQTRAFADGIPDRNAEADQAIRRGIEARRRNADQEALQEFEKAYALVPSTRAAAQIGLACQALGRWAEAEEKIAGVLAETNDPWIQKNRGPLEESLKEIRGHVGTLDVIGSPPGAEVLVEGRRVGALPLPGPVRASAGTVSLEVRADGYLPIVRNVLVSADQLSRESVNLTRQAGSATSGGAGGALASNGGSVSAGNNGAVSKDGRTNVVISQPGGSGEHGRDWRTPATWATGLGAVAFGATGVVALVIRSQRSSDLERKTGTDKTCTMIGTGFTGPDGAACVDLANSRDTWTAVAIATFATAAVAAGSAAFLWATKPKEQAAASLVPHVALVPDGRSTLVFGTWRF